MSGVQSLYMYIYIYPLYRSEGLPLRDMLSLVRGGWDLDALGKFFRRRRRRRRRPRPHLFRQFLEKVVIFSHFHQKLTFCDFCFKGRFFPQEFSPKACLPAL